MSSEIIQPPATIHRSKARGKPYFRTPVISPKGDYVAFVYAGDIWLVETSGGFGECLATHYAAQMSPRFSPDGTLLAFSSNRTGHGDIYVLTLSNGEVQRLTYTDSYCNVEDWAADGQSLYFTADREGQGDAIYRVPLTGGTPILICAEPYEELAHVAVSPSGEQLAFNNVYRAWWNRGPDAFAPCDIWLADLVSLGPESKEQTASLSLSDPCPLIKTPHLFAANKQARGFRRWPMWDPDGTGLYFVSDQTGAENLWFQSFENNEPRQITHFSEGRLLWPSIAREKKLIVFEHDWQIWQLDLSSEEVKPIPINIRADTKAIPVYFETRSRGFSELNLAPDGEKVAFVARGKIFVDYADKETDKEQRQGYSFALTELVGSREHSVVWTPDSRSLLYISDRHGEDEIYRYDFATRSEIRLTNDFASKWSPKCSPDGQWLAFIRNLETIYLLDLKTNALRPLAQGNFLFSNGLAWSPDSRWLAYISHDHRFFSNVYLQNIDETESRQITFLSNIMGGDLHWAPNGEFLVFTSGQYRLESRIVRVDLRPPKPLLRETEFEKLFEDRPVKKRGSNGGKKDEPEPENLSSSPEAALASSTKPPNETKEEPAEPAEEAAKVVPSEVEKEEKKPKQAVESVEIIFEGIERRLRFLTPIQMDASVETISPDSRDLLFLATVADKVNIWMLALDEPRRDQPLRQLTSSGDEKNCVQFVPNGKKFFALEDGQIVIRKFPQASDSTTLQVRSEVMIDFHQDKSQVFNEAWRLLRDTFYDPTFQGQDWNALREQFIPLIDGAQTKNDLRLVINLMVGELRASHLGTYYYGAGWQSQTNDGYTGLLFDPVEQAEHGFLRITGLVPDSPVALLPDPPKLGEYLIAVNGNPLTSQSNLDQCLQRTAGRRVVLRLALTPPMANGTPETDETQLKPREMAIRPIDSNTYRRLRYRAWVAANKAYVQRISAARLGYVHVADMSYAAYQQFLVDLDTENYRKDGIILDIRYNRGGHIATFIMDVLTRCSVLLSGFRDRLTTNAYHYSGNRALNKPTVLVTNERSASNAEIFTEMYRRLGLGKIVGQPTAGAVIGTIDWPLVNGLFCRLPLYAIRTPEGENLEGKGRAVDVEVAHQLGEGSLGHDQQLATAVATLLADLGTQT